MALSLDQLEEQLLALPTENRERLAVSLWESLPDPKHDEAQFSADYTAELDRRSEDIRSGSVKTIPLEAVMQHIQAILQQG